MDVGVPIVLCRPGIVAHDDVGVEVGLEGIVEFVRVVRQPEYEDRTDSIRGPAKFTQVRQIRHETSDRHHHIRAGRSDHGYRQFQWRLDDSLDAEEFGKALREVASDSRISVERIREGARHQHVRAGQRDGADEIHPY